MMLILWNWHGCYQWNRVMTVMIHLMTLIIYKTSASAPESDPLAKLDLRLGQWDSFRFFKTFNYAVVGNFYTEISATRRVCLATQSSIDRLQDILNIAAHWSGPISLAVFVVGDEMQLLQTFVMWLLTCRPETHSRLALHVTTPLYRIAVLGTVPYWARNCSEQPSFTKERIVETEPWRGTYPYPQNLLRNLARKSCHTSYVYLVDIDIVPSKNMAEDLDQFLSSKQKCKKCAYVIPTYELNWSAKFPMNKSELLRLVKKKLAVPFHKEVHKLNQLSSDLELWEAHCENETNLTHVSHAVTDFKIGYEPFYVSSDSVPPHDERFLGYGFTRNLQVFEMFLNGYKFKVLSPIFTIHWGFQSIRAQPGWRIVQKFKNHKKALILLQELIARYGKKEEENFSSKKIEYKNNLRYLADSSSSIISLSTVLFQLLLYSVIYINLK